MDTSPVAASYAYYAKVYDASKGDRSKTVDLISKLIRKYKPRAKTVLELACGTGTILEGLTDTYQVTGLDISPNMLSVAKQKMPDVPFYVADMSDFHLGQKFDAIYCIHNSIHHLLSFDDWVSTFDCAAAQLKRGGIFIFDVNTIECMEQLTDSGIGVYRADDDVLLTKVTKHPVHQNRYNWETRTFIRKDPYSFSYYPSIMEVSVFPQADIIKALSTRFTFLDIFTLKEIHAIEDIDRLYFVCQKN